MSSAIQQPQVRDYLDFREYLKSVYTWRKELSPGFSYSEWADELGFKSRSFVRLILVGKRSMTQSSTLQFSRNLKLKKNEAEYFELLVKFNQAIDIETRKHYEKEVLKNRGGTRSVVHDHFRFLSSHLGPRIQVLLSLNDIDKTAVNFAQLLGAKIEAVEEMLAILENLDMAERRGDGWIAKIRTFELKDNLGDLALQSFHKKSLEESIAALDITPSLRKYLSLILPLSLDEFSEAHERIYADLMDVFEKYKSDLGSGRCLYQINLNLIPITGPLSTLQAIEEREPRGEHGNQNCMRTI